MAVAVATAPGPAAAKPTVAVENLPEVQATETASQPVVVAGTATFEEDVASASVGCYTVPSGMVLVLDGATADLQASTTIEELALVVMVLIAIPCEAPTNLATDPQVIAFPIDGGTGFFSIAASAPLPPMHLPPGTSISVYRNSTLFAHDARVIVSGHLVPAVAAP